MSECASKQILSVIHRDGPLLLKRTTSPIEVFPNGTLSPWSAHTNSPGLTKGCNEGHIGGKGGILVNLDK